MRVNRRHILVIASIVALYALITWLLFSQSLGGWLQTVSAAFIYTLPCSVGALVCFLGYKLDRPSGFWAYAAPALTMFALVIASLLFNMEAIICAVVAAPILMIMAFIGGVIMSLILKRTESGRLSITFLVLLPYAVSPIEQMWQAPHETRVMQNAVTIKASPAVIWNQIYQVPAIRKEELPAQWIYLIGFPRPIAATIDKQGIGGRRHATFERDVSFFEVVTVWEPQHRLSFTIKADPEFIPHTAFDRHIIVGGRFYDVLDGTYEIEPRSDGTCILHLSSTHRLSTRFNRYAGWWSEWVMNQIQGSILEVIRQRCEHIQS
ncbi:hypothetical protein [Prosthecobacter sp.]|uniref:hypothetical protein n=1 Tax=Prosthecobacter sp. TaxID=1965333 RepID=UPI00378346D7